MTGIVTASGADLGRAHLVGIGGAGMSAIAALLLDRGAAVSGSDAKSSHTVTGLAARGALVAVGQRAENLDLIPGGPTAVVVSTAIRSDNAIASVAPMPTSTQARPSRRATTATPAMSSPWLPPSAPSASSRYPSG